MTLCRWNAGPLPRGGARGGPRSLRGLPVREVLRGSYGAEELAGPLSQEPSYYYTGGLAAANVAEPTREAPWQALVERRTFATSGDRIQLWFFVQDGAEWGPMGSQLGGTPGEAPHFRVHAIGSPDDTQRCEDDLDQRVGREGFTEHVCRGHCYREGDQRRKITRFEIVRIRRQRNPCTDDVGLLIDDPFDTKPCVGDGEEGDDDGPGEVDCWAEFDGEDVLYHVRAIQEPTLAVNGDPLQCEREDGRCVASHPCDPNDEDDDCLSLTEERAWSSPIYLEADGAR